MRGVQQITDSFVKQNAQQKMCNDKCFVTSPMHPHISLSCPNFRQIYLFQTIHASSLQDISISGVNFFQH